MFRGGACSKGGGVVVVALLFYVHGKHLRSCRDGGGGGRVDKYKTRNSTSYDIRLSIYNDGVRPVEMK